MFLNSGTTNGKYPSGSKRKHNCSNVIPGSTVQDWFDTFIDRKWFNFDTSINQQFFFHEFVRTQCPTRPFVDIAIFDLPQLLIWVTMDATREECSCGCMVVIDLELL
jgi:hypothetical protein